MNGWIRYESGELSLISVKADIKCDGCGLEEKIILQSSGTRGMVDGGFSTSFQIFWETLGAKDWMGLIAGTFCLKCYEEIRKSREKKKGGLFGFFK